MKATYEEFAEYLIKNHHVFHYRPDTTVHSYIGPSGQVCFWSNWKGDESELYVSLKALCEHEGISPPDRSALTIASSPL